MTPMMLAFLFYTLAILWLWDKYKQSYAMGVISIQEYRTVTLLAFFWPITFVIILITTFLLEKVFSKSER